MGITIREVDLDRELPLVASTVNEAFGSQVPLERFRWLYLDNPDGRAVAWFAVDDKTGDIAGCTAVSPRRVRIGGQDVVAWNCGDFSIGVRYRTMGAAVKLRRAARDGVDAGQSAFLYAHPNDRMLPVHLRVGHSPLAKMRRFARPLRVATGRAIVDSVGTRLLSVIDSFARVKHEAEVVSSGPLPVDVEHVYDAVKDRIGTAVVRDRRYLDWRFNTNPEERTEAVITRDHGNASGYLVFTMKGTTATVKDWLAVDPDALGQLFRAFLREVRKREATSASLIALETHPDLPAIRRWGFMQRPESSTAVTYAAERYPFRPMVSDPSRWYMTLGDRDV